MLVTNFAARLLSKRSFLLVLYASFYPLMFLTNDVLNGYYFLIDVLLPIGFLNLTTICFLAPKKTINQKIFFGGKLILTFLYALKNSTVFVSSCLYILSLNFSTFMYPSPDLGWFLVALKFSFLLIFYLSITVYLFQECPGRFDVFLIFLVFFISLNACINLYFYFVSLDAIASLFSTRFYPTFGFVPDNYITTSAMTYGLFFLISIHLFYLKKNHAIKSALLLCCLLLASALMLTQSRGSVIACILSLLITVFPNVRKVRLTHVFCGFLFIFTFMFAAQSDGGIFARGASNRLEVWTKFINLSLDRPIFGYGQRIEFVVHIFDGETLGHAHNILLGSLIRGGLVSNISLICILVSCMYVACKFCKVSGNKLPLNINIYIFMVGLFDFEILALPPNWQWISFWMPIAMCSYIEIKLNKIETIAVKVCNISRAPLLTRPLSPRLRQGD